MTDIPYGTRVHVSRKDISAGMPLTCNACPVALALDRKFPGADRIEVRGYNTSGYGDQTPSVKINGIKYRVSDAVRRFVLKFDNSNNGHLLEPFGFRILGRLE